MTTKRFKVLAITTALVVPLFLAGSVVAWAEEPGEGKPEMAHPGMADPAMMEEEMIAMHQEMHSKMVAMDSKLAELVAEMEAASGRRRTDAVAAVVTELVAQRRAMREMMIGMRPQMMRHMAQHMTSGMMQGMRQSMGECPMMQQMSAAAMPVDEGVDQGHEAHHPDE